MKLTKKQEINICENVITRIVLKRFPNEKINNISKFDKNGGCWNPIYKVELKNGVKLCLKIINPSFVKKFKTLNEVMVMKLLKQNTKIPVPFVYDFGCEKKESKFEYILMQFIDGVQLSEVENKQKYYEKLKDHYMELKNIKIQSNELIGGIIKYKKKEKNCFFVEVGKFSDVLVGGPFKSIFEYFQNIVQNRIDEIKKLSQKRFIPQYKKFIEILKGIEPLKDKEYIINHHDLGDQNIIVNEESGEIAAILDWEWAEINVVDFDIDFLKVIAGEKFCSNYKRYKRFKELEDYYKIAVCSTTDFLKYQCWFDNEQEAEDFIIDTEKEFVNTCKKVLF